ncbi:MAG: nucleotidyl transferase AbiEii/AbiGii toxin family protein [Candidatus Omnitrophota bacterium]|jgi:predicted nucleotidyltransferase component of viral defense system
MKDYVLELVSRKEGYNAKLNTMREYLQAYTLRLMHDEGVFRSVAFLGGTALRFLHGLPRFSEDLDFSLVQGAQVKFEALLKKIMSELTAAGYDVSFNYNDKKTVNSAFVKFSKLMFEAGLSPLKSQNFSIKIEIDNKPPRGAVIETQIVNKYFPISFLSYEINSLFAGKLHALLNRKYAKGRDYFDLGWYLSKWKGIEPNFTLLENALLQTGWNGELPDKDNWRKLIRKVVERADWKKIKQDVEQFLENPSDLSIFTQENVMKLLIPSP